MKKVKSTVLIAFSIVIIISLISSAVSFFGYSKVISSVRNIQVSKSNQDKVAEIIELAQKRQQAVNQSLLSMNADKKKDFEDISGNIDKKAKELLDTGISDQDKKLVNEIISINNSYKDTYLNKIVPDMSAMNGKKASDFTGDIKQKYDNIQKLQADLINSVKADINLKSQKAIEDITSCNNKLNVINKESAALKDSLNNLNGQLKSLTGATKIQNTQTSDIDMEQISTSIKIAVKDISDIYESSAQIDSLSIPPVNFDRVLNAKQLIGDITIYNDLNTLIQVTNEKYEALLLAVASDKDTAGQYASAGTQIKSLLTGLIKLGVKASTINEMEKMQDAVDVTATQLYNITALTAKGNIPEGCKKLAELDKTSLEATSKLRLSFDNYLANDFKTSEDLKRAIFWIFIAVSLLSLVIGMVIALLLSIRISNPIKALTSMLSKVEKGDLTVRVDIKSNDELGDLGKRVNSVVDGQQKMVEQFRSTTNEISTLKQRLIVLVNQNRESVNKISGNIKKADKNVSQKALDTQSIIKNVETVSEQTKKAVGDGIKAIEVAKSREKTVKEAEKVISSVNETVKAIANSITTLESSSDKIGEITNTITQIASQTNLLALNAAIEANRAGKEGKGFAVVADEIRKLSNASNKSAGEIKEQIREIQTSISFAAEKMNKGMVGVENGVSRINEVKAGIAEIIESVNNVVEEIKASADKANTQFESTRQFVDVVDNMAKTMDESASTSVSLHQSIEMQANTLKDLDEITVLLNDASLELKQISDKVKV